MTCDQYADAILNLARAADARGADRRVSEHLTECASCARRYSDQRKVTAALRALSAADRGTAPSRAIEQHLIAAFAQHHGDRTRQAAVRHRMAWMLVAAALVLATAGLVWQAATRSREPRMFAPGGFIPLPTAATLPPLERGEIVRMEIAAAELPAYGIEVPLAAAQAPLEADVLVGQDGLPRAIRLVIDGHQD